MSKEAETIYTALIEEHGMPPSKSLLKMGEDWYLVPDDVDPNDPDAAVSTAVFRVLPPDQKAAHMAHYASMWAATFVKLEDEPDTPSMDPLERLEQIIKLAAARKHENSED